MLLFQLNVDETKYFDKHIHEMLMVSFFDITQGIGSYYLGLRTYFQLVF